MDPTARAPKSLQTKTKQNKKVDVKVFESWFKNLILNHMFLYHIQNLSNNVCIYVNKCTYGYGRRWRKEKREAKYNGLKN